MKDVDVEILRLINETSLTTTEIAELVRVSHSTVYRRAKAANIDLIKRGVALGIRKYTPRKRRGGGRTSVSTRIEESMTRDGMSLEWLSKKWSSS